MGHASFSHYRNVVTNAVQRQSWAVDVVRTGWIVAGLVDIASNAYHKNSLHLAAFQYESRQPTCAYRCSELTRCCRAVHVYA